MSPVEDENHCCVHLPYPHHFREKSTFWSETRFAPHLTISRTTVPFSARSETKIFHDLIRGMVEFWHLRHQLKQNPPVDVETNVLGRTVLSWRFQNPQMVAGASKPGFSSQNIDIGASASSCVALATIRSTLLNSVLGCKVRQMGIYFANISITNNDWWFLPWPCERWGSC